MKEMKYTPRKIGIMAIFISIGIILQYIENRILITPIPGGKLGLGNVVSIINIFMFGGSNAMIVAVLRAFLGTMLMGGASALPYSVAGAVLSTSGMILVKNRLYPKVSMIGISVVGATLHNFSQVCVAAIFFSSGYVFSYLPLLLVVAVVSGVSTGYVSHIFGRRVLER